MSFFIDSLYRALGLIFSLDREFLGIVSLSVCVSATALLIASFFGISISVFLALRGFPGKKAVIAAINTSMGLPPVVVGLFLYILLSRSGPLGFLQILYTPSAMVLAQAVLATPIVAGLSHSAIVSHDPGIRFSAMTLGATRLQATLKVLKDARYGVISAVLAALGRLSAEVGAVLIVGGNIAGYTRVMTTTIALEADKGDFELAIALGIVLISLAFSVNLALYLFQRKGMAG